MPKLANLYFWHICPVPDHQSISVTIQDAIANFKSISLMTKKKESFRKYIIAMWATFLFCFFAIAVFFVLMASGKLGFMPSFEELENPKNLVASEIISSDNLVLGKFWQEENRTLVEYEELSPYLVRALIATEDERFYTHSGVDVKSLLRAIKGIVTGNSSSGGGSTISQQLSKLLFPRESNSGFKLVIRKFREWIIAVKLERSYTKEEIITMYFNRVDFVNLAVGIKSASATYFNKLPSELEMEEAALLVGMLQNPSLYNPVRYEERATRRRNVVLGQMLRNHYINKEQYDEVKARPLELNFNTPSSKSGIAPYFRKYLEKTMWAKKPERSEYKRSYQRYYEDSLSWANDPLYGWCNKNLKPDGEKYDLNKDGLKIYTTINYKMQRYAELSVEEHLKNLQPQFDAHVKGFKNSPFSNKLSDEDAQKLLWNEIVRSGRYPALKEKGYDKERIFKEMSVRDTTRLYTYNGYKDTIISPLDSIKYYLRHLNSSFMAMDPRTGEVKAWVGGSGYGFTEIDMVRSGTYKRQVGSTCKPFLYTLAMQNGKTPCDEVPNVEQTFILPDGNTWTAKNSGKKGDNDFVTLSWGLANSVNQVSAWVMKQYSPEAMKTIMQRMGIYSHIDAVPSMFLGTSEITLYEIVSAYAVYANSGVYTTPYVVTRIEDKNGNVLARFKPHRHEALDENTAYLMVNLLQNVIRQGSGIRLITTYDAYKEYGGFTTPFAGKTGTTQNHSDGWFVGFTPELIAGVWTGANLRSIHFEDISRGQGSNMALPVFGRFFKKIYADTELGYHPDLNFERPAGFNVNLDCNQVNAEMDGPSVDEYF